MLLDERSLSRLKWRCRRGLLENDLFIERFFAHHEATLTQAQAEGMNELMALADNDLLDLLLARRQPSADTMGLEAVAVLHLIRNPSAPERPAHFPEKNDGPPRARAGGDEPAPLSLTIEERP